MRAGRGRREGRAAAGTAGTGRGLSPRMREGRGRLQSGDSDSRCGPDSRVPERCELMAPCPLEITTKIERAEGHLPTGGDPNY